MHLIRCEVCGREIDEEALTRWLRVTVEGGVILTGERQETDFCSDPCVAEYFARKCGRQGEPLVVCIDPDGYGLDLTPGRPYRSVPDVALPPYEVRVVDNSGEDYIYPAWDFVFVKEDA